METALKNVPIMEAEPPEGIVRVNGEWYYKEFSNGTGTGAVGSGASDKTTAAIPASGASRPMTQSEEQRSILDLFRN
jgi:penicillin-binding protein 1A